LILLRVAIKFGHTYIKNLDVAAQILVAKTFLENRHSNANFSQKNNCNFFYDFNFLYLLYCIIGVTEDQFKETWTRPGTVGIDRDNGSMVVAKARM